ncbi:MAG: (deoxy)nucleoside triphosphate pyrophosphohydrolase [Traorella sp.]
MKTIHVVAAIIVKDNKIMIAQRLKGEFAGLWEFPGGKIEKGETPQDALIRELYEEMELKISIHSFLMTAEYDYSTFHLTMDCFVCTMDFEDIQLHDHSAIKWISLDEDIKNINWVPADVQIIQKIMQLKNQFQLL